jgi:hypothetical protein
MGNQSSALGDEPTSTIAQKNLQHFDHTFKGELHRFNTKNKNIFIIDILISLLF